MTDDDRFYKISLANLKKLCLDYKLTPEEKMNIQIEVLANEAKTDAGSRILKGITDTTKKALEKI